MQQELSSSIIALVISLRRVCPTMVLKVQFPIPCHEFQALTNNALLEPREELTHRCSYLHTWEHVAGIVTDAAATPQLLEVFPGWPTSAVAFAKDQKRGRILIQGLVLHDATANISDVRLGVVGFRWRHVADHLAAIKPDPVKRRVRELVDVIPA